MNKNDRTISQKLKFIVGVVLLKIMCNLEVVVAAIALQVLFDPGGAWEYWVTIISVSIGGAISHSYINYLDRKERRMIEIYGNEM